MRIWIALGFCLCTVLVPVATRTVHVRGTIGNLHELGLKGWYSALNIRSATWLGPASGPDPATRQFNGELECNVVRDAHGAVLAHWLQGPARFGRRLVRSVGFVSLPGACGDAGHHFSRWRSSTLVEEAHQRPKPCAY